MFISRVKSYLNNSRGKKSPSNKQFTVIKRAARTGTVATGKVTDVSKGLAAPILRLYAVQELLEAATSPEMSINICPSKGVMSQTTCIFIHTVVRT
jgi:hypothetical protein